jgi:hypothetical protein
MPQTAFTENYFATIESAGERAVQIARQLEELNTPPSSADKHTIDGTTNARQTPSSFRRRLMAARTSRDG